MSIETILFKKKNIFPTKNTSGPFFPRLPKKAYLKQPFLSSKRFYSNHCSSYKTISVAPTRLLKAQFFRKKRLKFRRKTFWPIFPRIIDYDKPQGTKYKGPLRTLSKISSW